jgi:hypothetical protein
MVAFDWKNEVLSTTVTCDADSKIAKKAGR